MWGGGGEGSRGEGGGGNLRGTEGRLVRRFYGRKMGAGRGEMGGGGGGQN